MKEAQQRWLIEQTEKQRKEDLMNHFKFEGREAIDMDMLTMMDDFDPAHMLTFVVAAGGQETFYIDMSNLDKEIKIIYMVTS